MTAGKKLPPWLNGLRRYQGWLFLGLILLLTVTVRVRLRDMPLERDEGEYAYAGQLLLQGVAPYKFSYNMKLPGTYAAYALITAVFGQSASAIRVGLALINAASILLVFWLGRRWLDETAGIVAAAVFALLSLSPSVLGLAAHATHFVVLTALAGAWLFFRAQSAANGRGYWLYFGSGLLFGLSFLMKQHGALFAVAAAVYLLTNPLTRKNGRWSKTLGALGVFAAGGVIPYALTCLVLALAGVFNEFIFWTVTYARSYLSEVSRGQGAANFREMFGLLFPSNPCFWILAALGAVVMWWEPRLKEARIFLTTFAVSSVVAVSAGFLFRDHYFILLLPAAAWLAGVAFSRALFVLRYDRTIELFLAIPMLLLFPIGVLVSLIAFGSHWFVLSPSAASERIYGTTLFSEAARAGDFLRQRAGEKATIAVIGSEPQIYFYARRRSATGYIYTYPLMEPHRHASTMQDQMIEEIESARPEYVVYVNDRFSWLQRENSERRIFNWWESYWRTHYDLELTLNVTSDLALDDIPGVESRPTGQDYAQEPKYLLVLKRRPDNTQQSAR